MSEQDSPNYHELVYSKKATGTNLLLRALLIFLYVVFVIGFFLFCYITRFLPIFALCPVFTWMLVFFTWRYVSFDMYYKISGGMIELGRIKTSKNGRRYIPIITIHIKDAKAICLFNGKGSHGEFGKVIDLRESPSSKRTILIVTERNSKRVAVLFEGTARAAKLLQSYCPNCEKFESEWFE